jgi:hypothetical protein
MERWRQEPMVRTLIDRRPGRIVNQFKNVGVAEIYEQPRKQRQAASVHGCLGGREREGEGERERGGD